LSRREERPWMTLTGSRSCWLRSRWGFARTFLICVCQCSFHVLTLAFPLEQRGGAIRQELAKLKKEVAA
jgi:hypothetical protein